MLVDQSPFTDAVPADGATPGAVRARRGVGHRLFEALRQIAPAAELLAQSESPWASITFSGSRHRFTLLFTGMAAVTEGEKLIAALPDHEFTLPGRLVADATVVSVQHELAPVSRLEVVAEVLLLDEG